MKFRYVSFHAVTRRLALSARASILLICDPYHFMGLPNPVTILQKLRPGSLRERPVFFFLHDKCSPAAAWFLPRFQVDLGCGIENFHRSVLVNAFMACSQCFNFNCKFLN